MPMARMREGDTVRVVQLRDPAAQHLIVPNSPRAPRLGDLGMVIEVRGTGAETVYVVESDDGDGEIVWLAEFVDEEVVLESRFDRR